MRTLNETTTVNAWYRGLMFVLLVALAGSYRSVTEMVLIDSGLYRRLAMLLMVGVSIAVVYGQYRLGRSLTLCPPEVYLYLTWLLWCVVGGQNMVSNPFSPYGYWGEYRIAVVSGVEP